MLKLFIFLGYILTTLPAIASSISVRQADGEWRMPNGSLSVNAGFKLIITDQAKELLDKGLVLPFKVEFVLTHPKAYVYYRLLSTWFKPTAQRVYKLSYHPSVQKYRVRWADMVYDFGDLDSALAYIGDIKQWMVIQDFSLNDISAADIAGRVRMALDFAELSSDLPLHLAELNSIKMQTRWSIIHPLPSP